MSKEYIILWLFFFILVKSIDFRIELIKNPLVPGRTDEGAKCFIHRVRYIGLDNMKG